MEVLELQYKVEEGGSDSTQDPSSRNFAVSQSTSAMENPFSVTAAPSSLTPQESSASATFGVVEDGRRGKVQDPTPLQSTSSSFQSLPTPTATPAIPVTQLIQALLSVQQQQFQQPHQQQQHFPVPNPYPVERVVYHQVPCPIEKPVQKMKKRRDSDSDSEEEDIKKRLRRIEKRWERYEEEKELDEEMRWRMRPPPSEQQSKHSGARWHPGRSRAVQSWDRYLFTLLVQFIFSIMGWWGFMIRLAPDMDQKVLGKISDELESRAPESSADLQIQDQPSQKLKPSVSDLSICETLCPETDVSFGELHVTSMLPIAQACKHRHAHSSAHGHVDPSMHDASEMHCTHAFRYMWENMSQMAFM